jgi:hypothetical protein
MNDEERTHFIESIGTVASHKNPTATHISMNYMAYMSC